MGEYSTSTMPFRASAGKAAARTPGRRRRVAMKDFMAAG